MSAGSPDRDQLSGVFGPSSHPHPGAAAAGKPRNVGARTLTRWRERNWQEKPIAGVRPTTLPLTRSEVWHRFNRQVLESEPTVEADVMDIPPMQQSPVELIENIRRTIQQLNTRIAELEDTGTD
ncbi:MULTISPECIES: hypothetical protein [Nocardia]|uniref:hypothetical protein n=1 Tax=Nocardia TaxID=1817 RepID=UPI002659FF3A|nr:hypothetical protein [Nocardia sp. PE-7]WKG11729.1 hypothetical protein QX204_09835 [Nocardia sp. PE-7]